MSRFFQNISFIDIVLLLFRVVIIVLVAWGTIATIIQNPYEAHTWIDTIVAGIAQGSLYALIAIGYTLVYGVLFMINFAHGEFFMSGIMTASIFLAVTTISGRGNTALSCWVGFEVFSSSADSTSAAGWAASTGPVVKTSDSARRQARSIIIENLSDPECRLAKTQIAHNGGGRQQYQNQNQEGCLTAARAWSFRFVLRDLDVVDPG